MGLARGGKTGLLGVALNDVGPRVMVDPKGMALIADTSAAIPPPKPHEMPPAAIARAFPEFKNMPEGRWRWRFRARKGALSQASLHASERPSVLHLHYL